MFRNILIFISILLIVSCNEEKIINDVVISQEFVIAVDSTAPKLVLYDTKNGILSNDIYFDANGTKLEADVSKITEYGGMLFLLMPSIFKIAVIDKFNFKLLTTFDFSPEQLEPTDICFANGSDGYVCHGNDSTLTLIDIKNLKITRSIAVGREPVSVACAGNQIFVANRFDNTVSIVDSRTHKEEAVIKVNTAPCLVAVNDDNDKALVVSLGDGKLDNTKNKTAAKVTFIDVNTRQVTTNLELGTLRTKATEQEPIRLILTVSDWAYVQTKTHLLRLDVRRESGINTLTSEFNRDIVYHKLRNQILIIPGYLNEVEVTNANNAGKILSFTLNNQIRTIYPL